MYNIFIRIYIFVLSIWLTCWAADQHSHMFTAFTSAKETLFCMTSEVGWLTGWLVCVIYKFNLTGG